MAAKQILSKMAPKGDFKALGIDDFECTMLDDAFKAVTAANMWDFLARPDVPGKDGFMFSSWAEMKEIEKEMKYEGHSGSSYGWTMRQMEFIAKQGWDAYAEKFGKKPTPPVVEQLATVLGFTSTLPNEALTDLNVFADAIQNNQAMRQMIPDIDQQAEGLRKFQRGELTYAEMR